jgi:hypothetical protein
MFTHVISHVCPYAQKNTLAFVVASTVLMWFSEVAGNNGSVYSCNNLGEGNCFNFFGQNVATANTALGANEANAF